MTKKTQYEKILNWLKSGRKINPLQALRIAGSMRLGAHIYAMRRNGLNITRKLIDCGNGKHVAEYRLES
jgi:hypothetical protein